MEPSISAKITPLSSSSTVIAAVRVALRRTASHIRCRRSALPEMSLALEMLATWATWFTEEEARRTLERKEGLCRRRGSGPRDRRPLPSPHYFQTGWPELSFRLLFHDAWISSTTLAGIGT